MAQMQIVSGSKELLDLAIYTVNNGCTKVEDFFNILKQQGLKKSIGDLTTDEVKALKEVLEQAGGLAEQFLNKFGKELPKDWVKFNAANHIEFAEKLKQFRGNGDLSFNDKLRGGEGQLFQTPLADNLVIKRWFSCRFGDIPKSIQLLHDAKRIVDSTTDLNKFIDVVSVGEKGADWVIRGFNKTSVPIKSVANNSTVANVKTQVLEILSKQKGAVAKKMLNNISKKSENIHWSIQDKKIIIIDML